MRTKGKSGLITITRRVEFDAGHRIPNHASKCKNIHGHRYVMMATVQGPLKTEGSDEGMVVDFGDLKRLMLEHVAEPWDHSFLCYEKDWSMVSALACMEADHKTVLLHAVPTVENLVRIAFELLEGPLAAAGLTLVRVQLYETPNCWAVHELVKEEKEQWK